MRHLAFIYEITTTFIICAYETKTFLREMPLSDRITSEVASEIEGEILKAEFYIADLQDNFPGILRNI